MDGENNGKPYYSKWDDLGENPLFSEGENPLFSETPTLSFKQPPTEGSWETPTWAEVVEGGAVAWRISEKCFSVIHAITPFMYLHSVS